MRSSVVSFLYIYYPPFISSSCESARFWQSLFVLLREGYCGASSALQELWWEACHGNLNSVLCYLDVILCVEGYLSKALHCAVFYCKHQGSYFVVNFIYQSLLLIITVAVFDIMKIKCSYQTGDPKHLGGEMGAAISVSIN